MIRREALAALAACLSQVGCGEVILRSGLPAGETAAAYRERWHGSLLFGMVEPQSAAGLGEICPRGWSEVRTSSSFITGVLSWGTLGIYTPTTVTVVCAAPPGVYIGVPGETPLPPLCR